MKAFTVATGAYGPLARITAACFEWATGIAPTIITECPLGPHAEKLRLPDADQYVFFDADLLFRRKVALPDVAPEEFAAVQLQNIDRKIRGIAQEFPLPRPMLSTGLFIASTAHRPLMARAAELMQANPDRSSAYEETWLNVALAEAGVPIVHLPNGLNQQRITNAWAATLHFCAEKGPERKLAAVLHNLQHHAPDGLREFLSLRGLGTVRPSNRRLATAALVRSENLRIGRDSRLAPPVGSHDAAVIVGEPVQVPELVRQDVNQE